MFKQQIGTLALVALALTGCQKSNTGGNPQPSSTPSATTGMVKAIYTLPACDTDPDASTQGTVNIVLPDKFDGNAISRVVNQGPKEAKDNVNTGVGQAGFSPNKVDATAPFDVYVTFGGSPPMGYLLARVLLTKGSKFTFYQQNADGFFGIGRNDQADATLCGAAPVLPGHNPGQGQAQDIATFYIDLAKLNAKGNGGAAHFTAALVGTSTGSSVTPILIDPKIIDDGM